MCSRVPYVNLFAVLPRTRQQSPVRTVGQRLLLAVAPGDPKGVDSLARRGFRNARAPVGIRGRDAGSVRTHCDGLRDGPGTLELPLLPGGRDVPDMQPFVLIA